MKAEYSAVPSKVSSLRHDMNEFLVQQMRKAGWKDISPSHGGIIYALLNYDVLTMKQIAIEVKRDPSTVTTLVNKLVRLGYAEYIKNPNDLRSKHVKLTQEGKFLYDDFNRISQSLIDALFENIEEEEIEKFIGTIEKLNENIEKHI